MSNMLHIQCLGVDLWRTDAPADTPDYNGTFSALMYNAEIQKILAQVPSKPMFLYAALQDMHAPNQVQLLVANHRII